MCCAGLMPGVPLTVQAQDDVMKLLHDKSEDKPEVDRAVTPAQLAREAVRRDSQSSRQSFIIRNQLAQGFTGLKVGWEAFKAMSEGERDELAQYRDYGPPRPVPSVFPNEKDLVSMFRQAREMASAD